MYHSSTPESIQTMFASIATHYDRANALFSLGLHKKWNHTLVKEMGPAHHLLDLCAGTGEIAFPFLQNHPSAQATLLDFCPEMLQVATTKGSSFPDRFETIVGDAQKIPLPDQSVDAVTIAYGIRNVEHPYLCFQEVARVLKPQGRFGILELTRPPFTPLAWGHKLYLKTLLPILGKLAAQNIDAYRYLAKSINSFSSPTRLENELKTQGLTPLKRRTLLGGVATIIIAERPS